MATIYFNKFHVNPKVLDEDEFPVFKSLYTDNPEYKYYTMPVFKKVFYYYLILYSILVFFIITRLVNPLLEGTFVAEMDFELSEFREGAFNVVFVLSMISLFSFIPSLHNYLDAYFDCKKMNVLLRDNVLYSDTYQDYLKKPRY